MQTSNEPKIIVAIRKRPLNKKEVSKNDSEIVDIMSRDSLIVKELREKVDLTKYIEEHTFTFDAVFSETQNNYDIYNTILKPLVNSAFNKAKVTCFAYGQTGSGKTFTMMGNIPTNLPGLYLLAANDIFTKVNTEQFSFLNVGISFYEIYCGKAHDLLNNREHCPIRVDAKENVNIVGLKEKIIQNSESLMALIKFGMGIRISGSTGANEESSRSHAILQIALRNKKDGKVFGKMSFIDLAGSERGADVTDTNKQTRFDGAEINKSLLALKECIRALDLGGKHLPFRGSKLTLVLKDSFVGNCKTVMIGNISPALASCEHTLNTLRYADRVKELKKSSGGAPKGTKEDKLARELMLPRNTANTNRIAINEQKTTDDNIVFEEFNINDSRLGNINKPVKFQTINDSSSKTRAQPGGYQERTSSNTRNNFGESNSSGMYPSKYDNFYEDEHEMDDVEFEIMDDNEPDPPKKSTSGIERISSQQFAPNKVHTMNPRIISSNSIKIRPVDNGLSSPTGHFPNTMTGGPKPMYRNSKPLGVANSVTSNTQPSMKEAPSFENPNSFLQSSAQRNTSGGKFTKFIPNYSDKTSGNTSGIKFRHDLSTQSGNKILYESTDKSYKNTDNNSKDFTPQSEEMVDLVDDHKNQIDDMMVCIKEEMRLMAKANKGSYLKSH